MMPDYIKIEFEGTNGVLNCHSSLRWKVGVDVETGQLINDIYGRVWRSAKYGSLYFYEIVSQSKTVYRMQGSIHKHAFNGNNSTDFSFERFVQTVKELIKTFQTDFSKWKLLPFEFGLNLELPFAPSKLLSALLNCKGKEYCREDEGKMYHFDLRQYKLKIYDKGFFAQVRKHILRIEIHLTKLQFVNKKMYQLKHLLIYSYKKI